jgi:hypothetical protein
MRIGVPILIAVLLIISTVSITLAVSEANIARQYVAVPDISRSTANSQGATGAKCANCIDADDAASSVAPNTANCPNAGNCVNAGNCSGTCSGNNNRNCGGTCLGTTATTKIPSCHSAYGTGTGTTTARGGCGSCRTY